MIRHATFEASLRGLEGLFTINGVPITAWTEAPAETTCVARGVARWLLRGRNQLTAITQRGRSRGPVEVEATLDDHRGEALVRLRGSDANGVLSEAFELEDGSATGLWHDAEVLEDADAHRRELFAALEPIRGSIIDRDVSSLLRLRAYALRDEAKLHPGLSADKDWTVTARAVHEDILSDASLTFVPFPSESTRYELVGGGRILSVWSAERTPPLRFIDSEGECAFSMELHFARIRGTLVWVR